MNDENIENCLMIGTCSAIGGFILTIGWVILQLEQLLGARYVTLQVKLNEEKSKHAGLFEQNGFGPAFLQVCWGCWKAQQTYKPTSFLTQSPFL
jgi:hypothetical protein